MTGYSSSRFMLPIAAMFLISPGFAQTFPTKPIRFVVPFTAGGGADATARLVAPKLAERLGQQVVIDNRSGAGGTIGAEAVARAAPDGYTMLLSTANLAMSVSLFNNLRFDPLKDFAPVTLLVKTPSILAVHPSLPARSVKQLIALARTSAGKINYAGGVNSTLHLDAELFKTMAKVDLVHVSYNGTAPAVIAALSGEAPVIFAPTIAVLPHAQSGRLRALAITSAQRSAAIPELPTIAEAGVPGYNASQFYGVFVPTGTPHQIISRLHTESVQVMQASDLKSRFVNEASIVEASTPQDFAAYFKTEVAKWQKVVKLSGARVE